MRRFICVVALLLQPLAGAIQFFKAPGEIPTTVPARCRAALTQNVTCPPVLITGSKAANGDYLIGPDLDAYFCIKDETGLCLPDYYDDKKTECSDCALKYAAVMLSSDYGRARIQPPQFSSLLSSCSVAPSKYPWTYTPTAAPAVPTSEPGEPPRNCTGTQYTVKKGDTCESISRANSVATDRMIDLNKLDYSCNTLQVGSALRILDKCTTMVVEKNQTCASIIKGKPIHIPELEAWNPTLASLCSSPLHPNLDALFGRTLCLSPPGGAPVPTLTATPTVVPTKEHLTITSPIFSEWKTSLTMGDCDPANATTSWYTPTFNPSYEAPTSTISVNFTEIRHIEELRKYCWITDEDERHLFAGI
ncbi:hypothetical protein OQA88_5381 [Cercophora sp. LCS_1]